MSFTNAPVTRSLVVGLVASSVAASLFDVKHYFYILVDRHVWQYHQLWRMLIFQLCYTNSTEVLFAAMTLYNMRVVERLWGSRKYAVSKCDDDYDDDDCPISGQLGTRLPTPFALRTSPSSSCPALLRRF